MQLSTNFVCTQKNVLIQILTIFQPWIIAWNFDNSLAIIGDLICSTGQKAALWTFNKSSLEMAQNLDLDNFKGFFIAQIREC